MLVVHYTNTPNFKLKPIVVSNGDLPNKPKGGLWASPVDAEFSWKDWCSDANFRDIKSQYPIVLDIDLSNFIVIDSKEDLQKLSWCQLFGGSFMEAVDFEELIRQETDGIYLTAKGESETRFTYPRTLYGWDCETVLILSERCIKSYHTGDTNEQ